jgi:hypothetical protein
VVLISVEALSADFMAAFGNREGTHSPDRSARPERFLFTRLYATGTHGAGLEALTLSFPSDTGLLDREASGQRRTVLLVPSSRRKDTSRCTADTRTSTT